MFSTRMHSASVILFIGASICLIGAQVAKAQPPAYSSPITISVGGTYSGNWLSNDPGVPAVTVTTTDPVVIKNCRVRGPGTLISAVSGGANLTIRGCYAFGLNPNQVGRQVGRFVKAQNPASMVIEANSLTNTQGIYVNGLLVPMSGALTIRRNLVLNINGMPSDGQGGYATSATAAMVQFVQLDKVRTGGGGQIEIAWNQVINQAWLSAVEDNISIYQSAGTVDAPLWIHDNYIRGAYPSTPNSGSYSGGGIIVDGGSGDVSAASAYVLIENNQVINTTNYGIAIAAGHDNTIKSNRIVGSNLLSTGAPATAANIGAYVWDLYAKGGSIYYNNILANNVIGWMNGQGQSNGSWTPNCQVNACVGNTYLSAPITARDDDSEFTIWQRKFSDSAISLGPDYSANQ